MPDKFTISYDDEFKKVFGPCLCDINEISCDIFYDMVQGSNYLSGITRTTDGFVISPQVYAKSVIQIHELFSCKQCKNRQKD